MAMYDDSRSPFEGTITLSEGSAQLTAQITGERQRAQASPAYDAILMRLGADARAGVLPLATLCATDFKLSKVKREDLEAWQRRNADWLLSLPADRTGAEAVGRIAAASRDLEAAHHETDFMTEHLQGKLAAKAPEIWCRNLLAGALLSAMSDKDTWKRVCRKDGIDAEALSDALRAELGELSATVEEHLRDLGFHTLGCLHEVQALRNSAGKEGTTESQNPQ